MRKMDTKIIEKRLLGIFLVVLAISLMLIDANLLYAYLSTVETGTTVIPIGSIIAMASLYYGIILLRVHE